MSEKEQDIYDAVADYREKNPQLKEDDIERIQLFEACRQVEHHLRALSLETIEVRINPTRVFVAPVSWSDDATGKTLFDALIAAKERKV